MQPADSPLRIALVAPAGRMGLALRSAIEAVPDLTLDDDQAQILIDFSNPNALAASLDRALTAAIPLVIGTTGLDDLADERIARAAETIPVLHSANMSLGVTLLAHLVEQAAGRLDAAWDISVLEMHHAAKIDAPSGTALMLGARASAAQTREIGYASLRGGTVPGDHDIVFAGPSERLILSHRAEDRSIFANGALAAARWIANKPPGRYTMADVLNLP